MRAIACTLVALGLLAPVGAAETLLIEAESFENLGGWSLDTAFTQIVGSPYLLASCQPDSSFHTLGGGMSFGSPFGDPAATQARIVSI